jgi:hypothetical protein
VAVCPNDLGAAGDGTTDDSAALAAATATGDDVFLKPGNSYLSNNATPQLSNGQRIYGGGKVKKTVRTWNHVSYGPQDAPTFFHIRGVNNVVLDGIELEWTGANNAPHVYGATIENATDCTIINCTFPGQTTPAFIWKGSKRTRYVGNTSYGGLFGLAIGGDGAGNTDGAVENTIVSGNIIQGAFSEAIDVNWDAVSLTISGNHLRGNNLGAGEEEIDIGGGQSRDIIVSGNVIDGGGHSSTGINLKRDAKYVKISDNILRDFRTDTGAAITVADGATEADIIANTIYGCNVGIWVHALSGMGVLIALNKLAYYSTFAVHLDGDVTAPLRDITVSDNKMDGWSVGQDGLLAEHVIDLIAQGNRAKRNLRGMRFGAGMSGIVTGNILKDNTTYSMGGTSNFAVGSIIANNVI